MNWLALRLSAASSAEHFEAWGHFRSFGRTSFVRGGVLLCSSAATGAGAFIELVYNFAQSGQWRLGTVWVAVLVVSALWGLIAYRRAWATNEGAYLAHQLQPTVIRTIGQRAGAEQGR